MEPSTTSNRELKRHAKSARAKMTHEERMKLKLRSTTNRQVDRFVALLNASGYDVQCPKKVNRELEYAKSMLSQLGYSVTMKE